MEVTDNVNYNSLSPNCCCSVDDTAVDNFEVPINEKLFLYFQHFIFHIFIFFVFQKVSKFSYWWWIYIQYILFWNWKVIIYILELTYLLLFILLLKFIICCLLKIFLVVCIYYWIFVSLTATIPKLLVAIIILVGWVKFCNIYLLV